MSSRQLKKLRAQEEAAKRAATQGSSASGGEAGAGSDEDDDAEDDGSDDGIGARARPKNAFAAFAALGGGNNGDEDEDEDTEGEDAGKQEHTEVPPPDEETRPKAGSKKKKKKKKKGAKAKPLAEEPSDDAAPSPAAAASAAAAAAPEDPAGLDEIDRALQELDRKMAGKAVAVPSQVPATSTATVPSHDVLIKVNLSDLRVLNELREVFGRDTIQAAQASDALGVPGRPRGEPAEGNPGLVMVDLETFLRADPPPPPGRVRIGGGGGGAGAAGMVAKRNPFIQWKDTWPRATSGGLAMRQVTSDVGAPAAAVVEYTFVHSPAYVHLEDVFFTMVTMHNAHPLIQFLKQHPFHIASLIQVSRIAKLQDQNASLAADLCERVLFSFGRATLSSFRQKLADGCARLSFRRPENRQFLVAGYHYIVSLISRGTYRTALAWVKLFLSLMPDDDYALALYAVPLAVRAFEARWAIELCGSGPGSIRKEPPFLRSNPMRLYIRQSLVPAYLQAKDAAGARAELASGIASLPWLYGALFQALGLDVPRAIWGIQPRDDAEALYTQLYIHLAKDIWDVPQATALLKEVAAGLESKLGVTSLSPAPPVTLSLARFLYLDGTPALMALAPQAMLHASPNYDFDPLPPPRAENIFSNPSQTRPWIVAQNENLPGGPLFAGGFPAGANVEVEDAEDDDESDSEGSFDSDDHDDHNIEFEGDLEEEDDQWRPPSGMPGAWYEDDDS